MTLEEARKVADAIEEADGGCEFCVGDICKRLTTAFPEFTWRLDQTRSEFDRAPVLVEAKTP